MCYTVRRILTKKMTYFEVIGCGSITNLIEILIESDCSLVDIEKLKSIVDSCDKCRNRKKLFKDKRSLDDCTEEEKSTLFDNARLSMECYKNACDILNDIQT